MGDDQGREHRARHFLLDDALGALSQLSERLRAGAGQVLDRFEDPADAAAYARRRLLGRLDALRRTVSAAAAADRALGLQLQALQRAAGAGIDGVEAALTALERDRWRLDADLDELVERCRDLAGRVEQSAGALTAPAPAGSSPSVPSAAPGGGSAPGATARRDAPWRAELDRRTADLADAEAAARRLAERIAAARERAAAAAKQLGASAEPPRHATARHANARPPGNVGSRPRPAGGGRPDVGDDIGDELARTRAAEAVEDELRRLKADLQRRGRGDSPGGGAGPGGR